MVRHFKSVDFLLLIPKQNSYLFKALTPRKRKFRYSLINSNIIVIIEFFERPAYCQTEKIMKTTC